MEAAAPPRAVVNVRIDGRGSSTLGVEALLDFSVGVALDGEPLSEAEVQELLASVGGLVRLKGKWVEVDREKLAEALEHWQTVEQHVREGGLTFFEGMRLLAGARWSATAAASLPESVQAWTGLTAGPALEAMLSRLRSPEKQQDPQSARAARRAAAISAQRPELAALPDALGLGACLADDMGLGKTVQVIALLLEAKHAEDAVTEAESQPCLLVVPASLIANWKAEIERFAPSLTYVIAHPRSRPPARRS